MAWTYSGDPSTSDKDKVRFLVGDTDTDDQLLNDAEINYCISQAGGSIYQSAHDAAYAVAGKFSRMATSKSVGDMSLSYSDRAKAYFDLANELLELGARREPPKPWASPQNLKRATDKDLPPTNGTEFYTGQHDYFRGSDIVRPMP
jgi:hypothetical protein